LRADQPKLQAAPARTFFVDNRAGAGGVLGATRSPSAARRYTILGGTISSRRSTRR